MMHSSSSGSSFDAMAWWVAQFVFHLYDEQQKQQQQQQVSRCVCVLLLLFADRQSPKAMHVAPACGLRPRGMA
jgi:hypothetical protein